MLLQTSTNEKFFLIAVCSYFFCKDTILLKKRNSDGMQIPLRFVFVYSFRLYDQNYTTIPSFFSELIGYLSKIICYGDIF